MAPLRIERTTATPTTIPATTSSRTSIGSAGRRGWLTLLGLILVPLIIAGAFAWGFRSPVQNLDRIQAAVVNFDEPATVGEATVPLGRQVTAALTAGVGLDGEDLDLPANLDWTLTDAETAARELAAGDYAAVITIPATFSAAATSLSTQDPVTAQIDVVTSANAAVSDATIARLVSTVATTALSQQLTSTFVENIYVNFSTIQTTVAQAADGASQLQTGSQSLSTGLDRAGQGAQSLADGLGQLDTGTTALAAGTTTVATGARSAATGATSLAEGLEQLRAGSSDLPTQTRQLNEGATSVSTGATSLGASLGTLNQGAEQAQAALTPLPSAAGALASQAAGVDTAAGDVTDGAATLQDAAAAALATCEQQGGTECGSVQQLAEAATTLAGQTQQLSAETTLLSAGAEQLPTLAQAATEAVTALAQGSGQAAEGATALATGAQQVTDATTALARAAPQLSQGITDSAQGARALAQGNAQLASGTQQVATGAATLQEGATGAADGAQSLAEGTTKLREGAGGLTQGATRLADGLSQGAQQIPNLAAGQRATIADVAAAPVTATNDRDVTRSSALAYLAALVLGISALLTYLLLVAVPRRTLSARSGALRLTLQAFTPAVLVGLGQALMIALVLGLILDLSFGRACAVAAVAFLGALTLNALTQALVAWLGGVGRLLFLAALAVSAPVALISTVPDALATVAGLTPFPPLTAAVRAVLLDESGLAAALVSLACWLFAGVVLTTLAIARARSVSPRRFPSIPATS